MAHDSNGQFALSTIELSTLELPEDSRELWQQLQSILSDDREQRLAYLLYHCGLGPEEIVRRCPQEWSDVQDIARLRRNILLRLLSADAFRV